MACFPDSGYAHQVSLGWEDKEFVLESSYLGLFGENPASDALRGYRDTRPVEKAFPSSG
jgi:hypothetical protein